MCVDGVMFGEGCLRLNEHVNFSHQNSHVHGLIIQPGAGVEFRSVFPGQTLQLISVTSSKPLQLQFNLLK